MLISWIVVSEARSNVNSDPRLELCGYEAVQSPCAGFNSELFSCRSSSGWQASWQPPQANQGHFSSYHLSVYIRLYFSKKDALEDIYAYVFFFQCDIDVPPSRGEVCVPPP